VSVACISLDLEPDFAGWLPATYTGWDPSRVEGLMALLEKYRAPLSIFVVAGSLKARPEVIDVFRAHGAEFHLHSFSHDLAEPDSAGEIERGSDRFAEVFGHRPEGYRAPQGLISEAGWRRLDAAGFRFDSSLFPSFWPHPRYLRFPRRPFRPEGTRLVEIPIGTLAPHRLIVSLSWINLLGWPAYRAALATSRWPEPLVFDMHLHDLWEVPSYAHLGRPYRWIYARDRTRGLRYLERFLELVRGRGYSFSTVGRVAAGLLSKDEAQSRRPGAEAEARLGSGRRPSTDSNSAS
jgi:peptidoglycan/xylan/chitin deacetylase (PgdA/CDA1 family)